MAEQAFAALPDAFTQAAASADAVITSGGVSVGEADHTKQVMRDLGEVLFWKIAMRPGKPASQTTETSPAITSRKSTPNVA